MTGCLSAFQHLTPSLMTQFAKETLPISLEEEMRRSYLDYAMSVIVGRALPDARDGLKPVHRRVLFAMHELNNDWNRPYKKSARIVGDVIGKYHPHGDSAVYDTIVRMAQDFSLRHMLVDGQGNFGSVDGDNAAAMRYTEIRLAKIAHEMLADIDKETVDFGPNYDGSEKEPLVLPARLPNLLINGSAGIAVGMATNIPPHNLNEVVDACLHALKNPECSVDELMEIIPAPDFPTAGIIYGLSGVREGYRTGRGRVVMRARVHFEDIGKGDRQAIIVDEIPYQVNKKTLLERIAELVNEKKIEGISHIQDESDKSGMRVVIELKRGEVPEVILNNLYKQTQLQDTFGINMVALIDGQPKLCNLKQLLDIFLEHRREVVTRRTVFELRKARERGHVLEGLAVALANIDEFIKIIRESPTPPVAKAELMTRSWDSQLVREMLTRAKQDGGTVSADQLPALRTLCWESARVELLTPRTMMESIHLTRVGPGEILQHRDGISINTPFVRAVTALGMFDRTQPPAEGSAAYKSAMGRFEGHSRTAMGFVWITGPNTRSDQIRTGRLYVRQQLQATALGVGMHPMSQAVQEFAEMAPHFERVHQLVLGRPAPRTPQEPTVQMFCRIGYPQGEVPATPRRPLARFVQA